MNEVIKVLVTKIENSRERTNDVDVWGRTPAGTKHKFTLTGCTPYFYTDEEPKWIGGDIIRVTKEGRTLRNQPLYKIHTRDPGGVPKARSVFEKHYEADVPYVDRVRYDCGIINTITVPKKDIVVKNEIVPIDDDFTIPVRYAVMDLEVDDKGAFPDPEEALKKVISIAAWDSYKDKYIIISTRPTDKEKTLAIFKENFDADIELLVKPVKTEIELFQVLFKWLRTVDPDIVSGWNFHNFDWKYLVNRSRNLGLDFDWRPYQDFDAMVGYDRLRQTKSTSLKLDWVAKEELGYNKIARGAIHSMEGNMLAAYNLGDVYLTKGIIEKTHVLHHNLTLVRLAGCSLSSAFMGSFLVDAFMFHRLKGVAQMPSRGIVFGQGIGEGAVVFEASTGLKHNIGVIDNKTEYPNIMRSLNMSPETRVLPGEEVNEYFEAPSGNRYVKEPKGLIPIILEELIEERNKLKREMKKYKMGTTEYDTYDNRQFATKMFTNTVYGVLGHIDPKTGKSQFRLADGHIGSDITAIGRLHARWNRDKVKEKFGLETIYGDTDSNMLQLPDVKPVETLQDIERYLNTTYDEMASQFGCTIHYFKVEAEKIYQTFFQAGTKKRYAGIYLWKGKFLEDVPLEDKMEIRGFEVRRSNAAAITKELQKHILRLILTEEKWPVITEQLVGIINKIYSHDLDMRTIGIPCGIQKSEYTKTMPIHARAAAWSNDNLDKDFKKGDKPIWYYVKSVAGKPPTDVVALEWDDIPDDFGLRIDHERMIQRVLRGPLELIFDAAGRSWDEVVSGEKQESLDDFF